MNIIAFKKIKDPYGWMGNMSPYPILFEFVNWRTAEALFQAMRFSDNDIKMQICAATSPMIAKFVARKNIEKMSIVPRSKEDVANMKKVLELKISQHIYLKRQLLETGDCILVEDTTGRNDQFWGANNVNGKWVGENVLGKLWMEIRESLISVV